MGRKIFRIFKPVLIMLSWALHLLPRVLVGWLWLLCDFLPGYLAVGVRYSIAKRLALAVGDNLYIGRNVEVKNWDKLSIGDNVSIHKDCYLEAGGVITIGDDVSIAHASSIMSTAHTWGDDSLPIKENPLELRPVNIDSDVWIGCGVRILGGTCIRARTVVAAGAVVLGVLQPNSVYAGVPVIKKKEL